jgi:hypothetical protein
MINFMIPVLKTLEIKKDKMKETLEKQEGQSNCWRGK